jgi:hypothetical protein
MQLAKFALVAVIALVVPVSVSARAQDRAADASDPPRNDVVVIGDRSKPMTVEEKKATPPPPLVGGYQPDLVEAVGEAAQRAGRCALKSRLVKPELLRAVLDGVVGSASQDRQLDWLVRQTGTCGMGSSVTKSVTLTIVERSPADAVMYRNAMSQEVLKRYAPDLRLTREQLLDAAVQRRFIAREGPLNKLRLSVDRTLFQVAVCAVLANPEDAITVAMADDVADVRRYSAGIVLRAPNCVGGSKALAVDPWQFRGYVADAVYRWAVAVRGTASLIPEEARGGR